MSVPYTFSYDGVSPYSVTGTRTALQVVEDAFHRIALISEDEALTAEQVGRGLSTFNDLLSGWEADGIQYQHVELAAADRVNVPNQLLRATTWMLVADLAMEYGKELSPAQQQEVDRSRAALQSFYTRVPQAATDDGILNRRPYGTMTITRM